MQEVSISPQSIDRYAPLIGVDEVDAARRVANRLRPRLAGRAVWNVNSTAHGGGVVELLRSLLPYVRGEGIDARWLVIEASPEFFQVTKRLHHILHGRPGDGGPLGAPERALYERTLMENAREMLAIVRPRDIVLLHDPQTAGLAPELMRAGAVVIWRCHIGADEVNDLVSLGWDFLEGYLKDVPAVIFTRRQYVPECCDHGRSVIIPPSIDPFSPKNQELAEDAIRAILVQTGLVDGPTPGSADPVFQREDGSPGRVDRLADIIRLGQAPAWEAPLVVQISRWDPLKDPIGVLEGFSRLLDATATDAQLILAGPNVRAIPDDPEGAGVFDRTIERWRALPHGQRSKIHLASLPMADDDENAAIVNALQRHATVVVQKSLREGFGLTVTEAMWKARPVLASAVGGIQEQIEDGANGVLLSDPEDVDAFAERLAGLLGDSSYRDRLGRNARLRVKEDYLGLRQLIDHAELLEKLDV